MTDPDTTNCNDIDLGKEDVLMILVHDFTSNGYTGWIKNLALQLLIKSKNRKILSVDWQKGAEPPFDQAAANARVVALEIKYFVKKLEEKTCKRAKLHIVGHGMGAHIAGYVGATCDVGVDKITALDPTGLKFAGMPDAVRLNPNNAIFVEVLHTDASDSLSQGTKFQFGHVDYYLNEAKTQPGCIEERTYNELDEVTFEDLDESRILPGCSHKRSFKYFIEAVKEEKCRFLGILNDNKTNLRVDTMPSCKKVVSNYFSEKLEKGQPGSFNLFTDDHPPFCLYPYVIGVTLNEGISYYGAFDFILIDENDDASNVTFLGSKYEYRYFIATSDNGYLYYGKSPKLGRIKEAKVRWTAPKSFCVINCEQYVSVRFIDVCLLDPDGSNITSRLCPKTGEHRIENGEFTTFVQCCI
ncbi:inactive pancreatic lipase-related protein 1 isoform X2 [Aethina tumida]|nr:inactive pancreatic lipase-related protein 1 isoform X2 [Aethina tumida]